MADSFDVYKEQLKDVDFNKARDEIAHMLKVGQGDAKNQGSELVIKQEFHDALVPFMSNPCFENAVKLLEVNPFLYSYFDKSKKSTMNNGAVAAMTKQGQGAGSKWMNWLLYVVCAQGYFVRSGVDRGDL